MMNAMIIEKMSFVHDNSSLFTSFSSCVTLDVMQNIRIYGKKSSEHPMLSNMALNLTNVHPFNNEHDLFSYLHSANDITAHIYSESFCVFFFPSSRFLSSGFCKST